jgi:hypothetical protein
MQAMFTGVAGKYVIVNATPDVQSNLSREAEKV